MGDSDFDAPLTDVRLEVDVEKLERYLCGAVPELANASNLRIKQFGLGTSNPTYLLWSESRPDNRFVVRRKPPGYGWSLNLFSSIRFLPVHHQFAVSSMGDPLTPARRDAVAASC